MYTSSSPSPPSGIPFIPESFGTQGEGNGGASLGLTNSNSMRSRALSDSPICDSVFSHLL